MCWASPVRNEQYQYVLVAISFGGGALFHSRPDPSFRNNKSCQGTGIPGSHGMEGKSPEALPQTWSSFQMVKATPTKWKARLYCSTVSPYKPKSWDQRYNTSQTQCKAIIVLVGDVMPPEISTQQLAPFQLTYEALRCFTYRTWKRYRDTTFQLWNSWNSLNHGILVQFHDDDSSYPGWVKYDSMTHWLISCNGNLQRKTLEEKKNHLPDSRLKKMVTTSSPTPTMSIVPLSHSSPELSVPFFLLFLIGSAQRLDPRQCKSTWEKKTPEEKSTSLISLFDFCYHPSSCVNNLKFFWEPRSNLVSSIWQVGNLECPKNKMGFAAIPQTLCRGIQVESYCEIP